MQLRSCVDTGLQLGGYRFGVGWMQVWSWVNAGLEWGGCRAS